MSRVLPFLSFVLLAGPVAAHPGHGEAGQGSSLVHHLSEPEHVLAAVAVLAVFVVASSIAGRYRRTDAVRTRRR